MEPVLVVNAGSTSVKRALVAADGTATPWEPGTPLPDDLAAVAHRVVHGGTRFTEPVLVDDEVIGELGALSELAPLHNVPALREIEHMRAELPGLPQIAVFDTAFHAHLDATAAAYAVPERWREEWGVRRYGFHGLSVEWSAERAAELLGKEHPRDLHLVVCHLGGGSSVTAVHEGRSADTTMGFTPLEGLPMTTRSGSIDPAILLSILRRKLLTLDELDDALHRHSGLAGLSGRSGDVRELESLAADDPRALFALELYAHRVAAAIAAMGTSLGRLDAIVFTGGIGEHSVQTRARVCERLRAFGVRLDEQANVRAEPDCAVSAAESPVDVLVITAREELVIARSARALLAAKSLREVRIPNR